MGNYKGFTSVKDVLIYLEMCEEEHKKTFSRLDKMDIGFFESRELKQKSKDLKDQLRIIKFRIGKCVEILEQNTTFSKRLFLNFLVKYLTLRDGVEYVVMDITENHYFPTGKIITPVYEEYKVITTVDNKNKIQKQNSNVPNVECTDDISDVLRVCNDKKYICLPNGKDEENYNLLRGVSLIECFGNYPYLREVAYDLVDLKLKNPDMSNEGRLTEVLKSAQKKRTFPANK